MRTDRTTRGVQGQMDWYLEYGVEAEEIALALFEAMTGLVAWWCDRCDAYRLLLDGGVSRGFTGAPISFATLGCGHVDADLSADTLEAAV